MNNRASWWDCFCSNPKQPVAKKNLTLALFFTHWAMNLFRCVKENHSYINYLLYITEWVATPLSSWYFL